MTYDIWAGVVNFPIRVTPGGYDLTGATCTLRCTDPTGGSHPLTMAVDSGNKSATYATTGTEFSTLYGPWTAQMKIVQSGNTFYTDEFTINVKKPH